MSIRNFLAISTLLASKADISFQGFRSTLDDSELSKQIDTYWKAQLNLVRASGINLQYFYPLSWPYIIQVKTA